MKKAWAQKHGFTIVELLVTIVVIGILAGITIISYNGISQRSRDSRRDSDVSQLKIAIEKYHSENSTYPSVCSNDDQDCSVDALKTSLAPYLKSIPHDPRNTLNSNTDYRYVRGGIEDPSDPNAVDSYGILITYESKTACKTGENIKAGWWGTSVPSC